MDKKLDDIISYLLDVSTNPLATEDTGIINFWLPMITQDFNVQIKEIYSANIFPCVLEDNGNKYLLWDMSFWYIYTRYYFALVAHKIGYKKEALKYIDILLSYFLALKLKNENSNFGFLFAEYFYSNCNYIFDFLNMDQLKKVLQSKNTDWHLLISKLFVALHECYHKQADDVDFSEAARKSIIDAIKQGILYIDELDEEKVIQMFGISKRKLIEEMMYCTKNTELLTELVCDIYAQNDCVDIMLHILNNYPDKEQIIIMCDEVINLLNTFTSNLVLLWYSWSTIQLKEKPRDISESRKICRDIINILLNAKRVKDFEKWKNETNYYFPKETHNIIAESFWMPNILFKGINTDIEFVLKKESRELYDKYILWNL